MAYPHYVHIKIFVNWNGLYYRLWGILQLSPIHFNGADLQYQTSPIDRCGAVTKRKHPCFFNPVQPFQDVGWINNSPSSFILIQDTKKMITPGHRNLLLYIQVRSLLLVNMWSNSWRIFLVIIWDWQGCAAELTQSRIKKLVIFHKRLKYSMNSDENLYTPHSVGYIRGWTSR